MIDVYLEYCESKQLRPRTIGSYRQALELFAVWLKESEGIEHIEDVKDATIRRYILNLQQRGKYTAVSDDASLLSNYPDRRKDFGGKISNCTINNYFRYIRAFFLWLVDVEYIEKAPLKKVKELPHQRTAKEYLDDEEVKAILKGMNRKSYTEYRDMLVMMIMLDCGTRIGETLSIERYQLDLVNRSILLPAEKTKGRMTRTVFFSQKTATDLRRWLAYKEKYCETPIVFPVGRDGSMQSVSHFEVNFRRYMKHAGITKQVSPHTLRNNFAKRCLLTGMDIYTLSRILGHSSVTITEAAYLDVKDAELKGEYNKFSPMDSIFRKKK